MEQFAVRITVVDGVCQDNYHQIGREFIVNEATPAGMCLGAWQAIAPYLTALRYGGNFPWESEKGVAVVHCPDPNGITFELRRIE
ncbi:TIGR04076 family protein [candidate division KSB1 bacterium]|nr:TIGR04076 family protein [candidate division KSB1 bacterium]